VPIGRTIRAPYLIYRRDTLYVAANVLSIDGGKIGRRAAVVLRQPGAPVPLPEGDYLFEYPKGVFDPAGDFHLLWGESREGRADDRVFPRVTSLWHAVLHGRQWSQPERLIEGAFLDWTGDQGSVVVVNGIVHVLVAGTFAQSRAKTLHFRQSGSVWQQHLVPISGSYATLATTGRDTLVAIVIARDTSIQGHPYSVMRSRSVDAGRTWDAAHVLNRAGSRLALAPHVTTDGRIVHLVWAEGTDGGVNSHQTLRYTTSLDGGETWSAPSSSDPLREGQLRFSIGVARCGEVLAMIESLVTVGGNPSVVLDEVRLSPSVARPQQQFSSSRFAGNAGIIAIDDTFHLALTAATGANVPSQTIEAISPACWPSRR
jgi:hypothetical protein